MITLVRMLIIFGLCMNVVSIWFALTKFRVLENVLLIHWAKMATAIFLAMLSFSVASASEFLELFLPSVYEGFLEQLMNSLELVLNACGLTIIVYTWLRVEQVEL